MVVDVAEVHARVLRDQGDVGAHEPVAHVDQRSDRALHLEQVALELVDPLGRLPREGLLEDVVLELGQLVLECVDQREVLVDDEVHERVEDEDGPFGQERRARLAA